MRRRTGDLDGFLPACSAWSDWSETDGRLGGCSHGVVDAAVWQTLDELLDAAGTPSGGALAKLQWSRINARLHASVPRTPGNRENSKNLRKAQQRVDKDSSSHG